MTSPPALKIEGALLCIDSIRGALRGGFGASHGTRGCAARHQRVISADPSAHTRAHRRSHARARARVARGRWSRAALLGEKGTTSACRMTVATTTRARHQRGHCANIDGMVPDVPGRVLQPALIGSFLFGGSRKKTPVGAGSDTAWHLGNDSDE